MVIFLASVVTERELEENLVHILELLRTDAIRIYKLEKPGLISDQIRKVQAIRVRSGRVEVRTDTDSGFRMSKLNELVVT